MKKIVFVLLILAISCAQETKDPIVMGFGLSLTGPMAAFGQSAQKGAL